MKTKSIFITAIFLSALFMQVNAQTVERQVEKASEKPVVNSENAEHSEPEITIVFDKDKHDFETIKESDGKVSTIFTFTNNSDSPIVISRVVTSCGCSAAEWTKEPVAPGKTGYVKATYDPTNRISFFNKPITVISNGSPSRKVLYIQGTAIRE